MTGSVLLTASSIDEVDVGVFVRRHGAVVATYDHLTQDSGNVSWLLDVGDRRLFVKTAGAADDGFAGRVALLRNAVEVARSCSHHALPPLRNVIETAVGPALVYDGVPGEPVRVPASAREDSRSAYQRFAHLAADQLLGVFDVLLDLHVALTAAGWVACDLYDGSLIVDFDTLSLAVVDLDSYRRGPSVNDMGRMYGSSRFMAPEEFVLGAVLDQRTTVFTLGRLVWHFGTRLTESSASFCGPADLAAVVQRACSVAPADRYATVAEMWSAWSLATGVRMERTGGGGASERRTR